MYDSLGAHDAQQQQQQQVHKPPPLPRQQNTIPKPPPSPTHAPQFTVSFNLWDWLEYYERPLVWIHMAIVVVLLVLLIRLFLLRAKKEVVTRFKAWWNRPWKSEVSPPPPLSYDYGGGGGGPPYSGGGVVGPNYGYGSTGYSTGYTTPTTPQQYGPVSGPRWNTSAF
jgi:hypothetical protein